MHFRYVSFNYFISLFGFLCLNVWFPMMNVISRIIQNILFALRNSNDDKSFSEGMYLDKPKDFPLIPFAFINEDRVSPGEWLLVMFFVCSVFNVFFILVSGLHLWCRVSLDLKKGFNIKCYFNICRTSQEVHDILYDIHRSSLGYRISQRCPVYIS